MSTIKSINIGDRVSFQGKDVVGTIEGFVLYESDNKSDQFIGILAKVKWDKGTDDWYKGEDLKLIEIESK